MARRMALVCRFTSLTTRAFWSGETRLDRNVSHYTAQDKDVYSPADYRFAHDCQIK
jgi:hypothetical protein